MLATAAVAAAVTAATMPPGMYGWLRPLFTIAAGVCFAAAAALLVPPAHTRPQSLAEAAGRLTEFWREPAQDRRLAGLGVLVSLPLWALHTRVVLWDPDSARIIAATGHVARTGVGYLVETQENWLPHLLMGPAIAVGGIAGAKVVSILSLQGLFAAVSYLTWKYTRSAAAALASVLALLCWEPVVHRATVLPMYPAALAFGFLALFVAHRSLDQRSRRWSHAFGAAALLVASMEAHALGQLFPLAVACLAVTGPLHRTVPGLARVYAALAVLYLPRALVNVAHGGLARFLGNRVDYWLTEGYLVQVQERFWHLPVDTTIGEWLTLVGARLPSLLGVGGALVVILAVVGLAAVRGRARAYALLCVGLVLLILAYRRIPLYPRYFSHLYVAAALLAGAAVGHLASRRQPREAAAAMVAVALLGVVGIATVGRVAQEASVHQQEVLASPLQRIAAAIDDGRAVVGARAGRITFVNPTVATYGGQFLTEREYVTFLTWPSDREVMRVLRRHDIGWVLVSPERSLEVGYHETWIKPRYGAQVRHPRMVRRSDAFCLELEADGYRLYRLGPCRSST